jgi:hypothetical protein
MSDNLIKALEAADRDWRNNVGEHDRASLDRMFVASGFARQAPRAWDAKVPDWCGMAVGLWLQDGGMNHPYGRSFLHCLNVEAFFTYGRQRNVNPKRLDTQIQLDGKWTRIDAVQAGAMARRWLGRSDILGRLNNDARFLDLDLFKPGDVVLLDWAGHNDADHITMVKSWDGSKLTTMEGNASGLGPAGEKRREAVVTRTLDLSKSANARLVYGVGRLSPMDFNINLVKP